MNQDNNLIERIKTTISKIGIQDSIFTFLISILIPMLQFNSMLLPLNISWIGALLASGVPIGIHIVLGFISTIVFSGLKAGIIFLIGSIIMILLMAFLKSKNYRNKKEFKYTILVMITTFISIYVVNLLMKQNDIQKEIIYSLIAAITYKIFIYTTEIIEDYKYKKIFSSEEIISLSILLVFIINIINKVSINGVSITNILVIVTILAISIKNNLKVGIVSASVLAIPNMLLNESEPYNLLIYLGVSIIASTLKNKNKLITIGTLIITSIILYITMKTNFAIEILVSSILLLILPKSIEKRITDIFEKTNVFSNNVIRELNKSKEEEKGLEELEKEYEQRDRFIFKLEEKLEKYSKTILFEEIFSESKILEEVFKKMEKDGKFLEIDFLEILENMNIIIVDLKVKKSENYKVLKEFIKVINDSYLLLKIKVEKENQLEN